MSFCIFGRGKICCLTVMFYVYSFIHFVSVGSLLWAGCCAGWWEVKRTHMVAVLVGLVLGSRGPPRLPASPFSLIFASLVKGVHIQSIWIPRPSWWCLSLQPRHLNKLALLPDICRLLGPDGSSMILKAEVNLDNSFHKWAKPVVAYVVAPCLLVPSHISGGQ